MYKTIFVRLWNCDDHLYSIQLQLSINKKNSVSKNFVDFIFKNARRYSHKSNESICPTTHYFKLWTMKWYYRSMCRTFLSTNTTCVAQVDVTLCAENHVMQWMCFLQKYTMATIEFICCLNTNRLNIYCLSFPFVKQKTHIFTIVVTVNCFLYKRIKTKCNKNSIFEKQKD